MSIAQWKRFHRFRELLQDLERISPRASRTRSENAVANVRWYGTERWSLGHAGQMLCDQIHRAITVTADLIGGPFANDVGGHVRLLRLAECECEPPTSIAR